MLSRLDPIDQALLDRFQRDFPLVPRPFTVLAETLGLSEALVIERLERTRHLQADKGTADTVQ